MSSVWLDFFYLETFFLTFIQDGGAFPDIPPPPPIQNVQHVDTKSNDFNMDEFKAQLREQIKAELKAEIQAELGVSDGVSPKTERTEVTDISSSTEPTDVICKPKRPRPKPVRKKDPK